MVRGIRDAEAALGDGRKDGPGPRSARRSYTLGRRSLIADARPARRHRARAPTCSPSSGPGFGIAPKHLELVLGRALRADVEADDVLTWEMV